MGRPKHPKKEIEEALRHLESLGWRIEKAVGRSAHSWGFALCPHNNRECRGGVFCRMSIWSTPRSPKAHGRNLLSKAAGCILEERADET